MILSVLPQVGRVAPLYNLSCKRMRVSLRLAVSEHHCCCSFFLLHFGQLSVPGRIDPWYRPRSLYFPGYGLLALFYGFTDKAYL